MITDGSMEKAIQTMIEQLKPEATYFAPSGGKRCAYIVFDLQEPSQLPPLTEPLFQGPHAKVTIAPVMNLEDLQKGMVALAQSK
jgi:hypothetical protein